MKNICSLTIFTFYSCTRLFCSLSSTVAVDYIFDIYCCYKVPYMKKKKRSKSNSVRVPGSNNFALYRNGAAVNEEIVEWIFCLFLFAFIIMLGVVAICMYVCTFVYIINASSKYLFILFFVFPNQKLTKGILISYVEILGGFLLRSFIHTFVRSFIHYMYLFYQWYNNNNSTNNRECKMKCVWCYFWKRNK